MQRALKRAESSRERVAAVATTHGHALLRTARHWSLCHDDALDAYQRGLEIFLRRAASVDAATEVAWLKVVIKHEALAIRRARQQTVGTDEPALDAPADQRELDELVAGGERVSRSAEALRALKPDEARALILKAEGLSYREIGQRCGWSYTKVNRAITEGRRRFVEAFRAIESGDACSRFSPVLAALAAGTASSAEVLEIRPHLRHCLACRATVRDLHLSGLGRLRLLLPGFLLAPLRVLHHKDELGRLCSDEHVSAAEKVLRECPPDEHVERARRIPLARAWDELLGLFNRASGSDVATGLSLASSGGGRLQTIATVLGFCLSGAGAGALCLATGVVEAPRILPGQHHAGHRSTPGPARSKHASHKLPKSLDPPPRPALLSAEATPPAAHRRTAQASRRTGVSSPAPVVDDNQHSSGSTPASSVQSAEFGFEASASTAATATPQPGPRRSPPPAQQSAHSPGTRDPVQEEFGP